MTDTVQVEWETCGVNSCIGIRSEGAKGCLAHDEQHREAALQRLSNDGCIDARGVTIDAELLEQILHHAPQEEDRLVLQDLRFERTTFTSHAGFYTVISEDGLALPRGVTFQGTVRFDGATFEGGAWFPEARFQDEAGFPGVTFQREALFNATLFRARTWFTDATFQLEASFDGARFEEPSFAGASFAGVRFQDEARFSGARFESSAWFSGTIFQGMAWFNWAVFKGEAWFGLAMCN
jgi:uncharacterized protein YjbI with pentapeptide repeats